MYGYNAPRRPELGSLRVMVRESELARYLARFPSLSREEILRAIATARQYRPRVEEELERLAAAKQGQGTTDP